MNPTDDALRIARALIEWGVPIFRAEPDLDEAGEWRPRGGHRETGYWLPKRWEQTEPDPAVIDAWRPGDALCMVTGVVVDVIDIDPRNGGDRAALNGTMPRSWGEAETPSGGSHDLIATLGVRSWGGLLRMKGIDLKAGRADGVGRGFVFIAPTVKLSKVTGLPVEYRWPRPPALDELVLIGDPSGTTLRDRVDSERGAGDHGEPAYSGPPFEELPSGLQEIARAEVERQVGQWREWWAEALDMPEGATNARGAGWERMATEWAWTVANLVASRWSHLDEAAGEMLHDAVLPPEVATDRICRGKWAEGLVAKAPGLPAPWPEEFVYTPEQLASTAGIVARPDLYIGRGGLRVARLAKAVAGYVTYAKGALDGRFYVYDRGVWRPEDCQIGAVVSALLGDAYRRSHLTNVKDKLRYGPDVRKIDCGPTPRWVNVTNGLLDWRTRELVGHTPDVMSTVQLPVDWNPEAACPEFEKFIREVLPADCVEPCEGGPGFIWELIGYCVYSGNPHHIAVLLRGKGRNGKGVFLRVIQHLLGSRNVSGVSLHDLTENRFRPADLYGRIANIAGDLDPKWLENTAKFKAITGDDLVSAEYKFGDPFSFTSWALPLYSANKVFGSSDSSEAYLARWVVVPFPNSFLGREDRGLDARLAGELEGVLRRGVEALPALMRRGWLPAPPSVRAAKHEFTIGGDQVRAWLDEGCEMDPAAWTKRTDLLEAYLMWDGLDGRSTLSKREFYARLGQVGALRPAMRDGYPGFVGVRLRE